jgi:hypothetical protein
MKQGALPFNGNCQHCSPRSSASRLLAAVIPLVAILGEEIELEIATNPR